MKIIIIPMWIDGFPEHNIAVRIRKDTEPTLFMQNVEMAVDGYREGSMGRSKTAVLSIMGEILDGLTLQDGDVLLVKVPRHVITASVTAVVEDHGDAYLSEGVKFNAIGMAARMEDSMCVCIADIRHKNMVTVAVQLFNKAMALYSEFPSFRSIMVKDADGNIEEKSLMALSAGQDDDFVKWAESMVLSMDAKYKTQFPAATQILESIKVDDGFTLLSKEEQVAAFLDFSRKHADNANEAVPDTLLEFLRNSPEYAESVKKLSDAGFGKSDTQQFNVLQQVGYLGGSMPNIKNGNVIYNLSDMGAGKTLMTVQAIFIMDCINIGMWNRMNKNEFVDVAGIMLPDKHIIAPALSVKASWVDTFKLFYGVEKKDEYHYVLTAEYGGVTAVSDLYIAPFTVRGGKVFVQEILPYPSSTDVYLIVDEIHQLVRRRISRTKFFVPKITPVERYRIFALSGTMSNLKAGEWLSLVRFLGDTDILENAAESKKTVDKLGDRFKMEIGDVAKDLEMLQHKKFNVDDISVGTQYQPVIKKKSTVEEGYFMQYGSKMLIPHAYADGRSVQDMLAKHAFDISVEPEESDSVSFELFYRIAATSAITAQSLQVAQELFGEQATQHKSSIIKTMSPFTDEEILLLDTLHKIAADSGKYRSPGIGRDINNAILNLNDGLQQKDLYTLVSGFAERNTKFLEYLAGLDVDVLKRLPKTSLISSPALTDTHKFHVLQELLEKDKDETFLIVVNDFYAMKALAEALHVSYLSKQELKDEMAYQELLDGLFEKQSIVIVTQDMIKSSLDLVQANRLVQYQLNTEVSDIIQTQNRINRIGQTRETRCFYIAADRLQNALIELFLESYRNIRVAHKGIVELFADLSSQIDVINDYLDVAFKKLAEEGGQPAEEAPAEETNASDLIKVPMVPKNVQQTGNGICNAILFPGKTGTSVIVPLEGGNPFTLGVLKPGIVEPVTAPTRAVWNLTEMKLVI